MLVTVSKAIKYRQSIEMIYVAGSGAITKRRVRPLQVLDGTFTAYCYLRQARRTFAADHILALVPIIKTESKVI